MSIKRIIKYRNRDTDRRACSIMLERNSPQNGHEWSVQWMIRFQIIWNLRRKTEIHIKTCVHSSYYTAEFFYFFSIYQFAECLSIYNKTSASCSVKFIPTVNKLVTPVNSFVVLWIFQYHSSNVRRTWLPEIIQKLINDSTIPTFVTY